MRSSLCGLLVLPLWLACSEDDSSSSAPTQGAGGSAGAQAGASGSSSGGSANHGGSAAASGEGGSSGVGGNSGSGMGATAGTAGGGAGGASGSGGSSSSDLCGPITETWQRCLVNPLWTAGHSHPDGRVELSIGDPDIFYDEDDHIWKAYWSTGIAPTFTSPEDEIQMGIKYAESLDGITWLVQEELVIEARSTTNDWDQLKLETPSVIKIPTNPPERRYMLVYSGAQKLQDVYVAGVAQPPAKIPWYQMGVAFSADGKHFTRISESESPYANQPIDYPSAEGLLLLGKDAFPSIAGVADGLVADPEVFYDNGTIHLFFSSMPVDSSYVPLSYGVSHATSTDGVHFTPDTGNPLFYGAGQPSIISKAPGDYELFFIEDTNEDKAQEPSIFNPFLGVWRASSNDLSTWSAKSDARDFVWDSTQETEVFGLIATGDMAYRDGVYRFYYPGWSQQNVPDGFVCPLQDGSYPSAVIVLNLARRK